MFEKFFSFIGLSKSKKKIKKNQVTPENNNSKKKNIKIKRKISKKKNSKLNLYEINNKKN